MPVSPSPNLKIVKNESDQQATKIPLLNTGIDEMDSAVAGMLTLSVAGGSNVVLTRLQALNRLLKFTGALTAHIVVFLPVIANAALPTTTIGSARAPVVWNATSGAFTLTVKTSAVGSTGVAVTQSKKVTLFHDDTNVLAASAEV